ncbi:MAG: succinate dehydrogenase cytochrome b subunit [Bacteroidota bacterium]
MKLFWRKLVVALTGLFLCLFLIVHLSANCLLLLPEALSRELYNGYSTFLRESLLIKIIAYALYLSIALHVVYAFVVTIYNRKTKPVKYALNNYKENSSWASQNMAWLGILILLFIIVHLVNFWARVKLGLGEKVSLDKQGNLDLYEVTYSLFKNIYYVIFYVVLMIPLGFHLYHGLQSSIKSLGFYHSKGLNILPGVSLIYALIISIGFGIIPLIVYFK